jgi:hypothetical protein
MSEELLCLKAQNETMSVEERRTIVLNWKKADEYLLVSQLGSKTQRLRFVHGMFFAPSFSTKTVPQLQRLFMADVATSTLANTHCFVAMELLPMETCPLLHLVLFLEMRMERVGRNFGSL